MQMSLQISWLGHFECTKIWRLLTVHCTTFGAAWINLGATWVHQTYYFSFVHSHEAQKGQSHIDHSEVAHLNVSVPHLMLIKCLIFL